MKNVVHKIYHLTFPCSQDYVGSTSQTLRQRYHRHGSNAKKSNAPICEISTQHRFKEVKMVEVDRIECPKYDLKIRMLEEKWKRKLNPTLNAQKAYRTEEERKIQVKECIKEYYKTPQGKRTSGIKDAKDMIKYYTKQNRPDMVLRWEGRLEERIQNRLIHQSN